MNKTKKYTTEISRTWRALGTMACTVTCCVIERCLNLDEKPSASGLLQCIPWLETRVHGPGGPSHKVILGNVARPLLMLPALGNFMHLRKATAYIYKSNSIHVLHIALVVWNLMSLLFLALCTSRSLAKIPNIRHQYVNGEDEIASILRVSPRISAVDLPSIECERRIGYNDGCSGNSTNFSICFLATANPLARQLP